MITPYTPAKISENADGTVTATMISKHSMEFVTVSNPKDKHEIETNQKGKALIRLTEICQKFEETLATIREHNSQPNAEQIQYTPQSATEWATNLKDQGLVPNDTTGISAIVVINDINPQSPFKDCRLAAQNMDVLNYRYGRLVEKTEKPVEERKIPKTWLGAQMDSILKDRPVRFTKDTKKWFKAQEQRQKLGL